MIIEKYVHLHEKTFDVEELDGETWRPYGKLHILPDAIVHNDGTLKGVRFHAPHNALQFHGGEGADRKVGRLDFAQRGNAFVGMIETAEGSKLIRGVTDYDEVFRTKRRLDANPDDPMVKWQDFKIKTVWHDSDIGSPILVVTYLLGGTDVSDRVSVTRVNKNTGETTIEMVKSIYMGDVDSFVITLAFGGRTFSGTYTDGDGTKYFWMGDLSTEQCQKRASMLQSATEIAAAASTMALYATNATLTLQDLDNVNSIMVMTDQNGKDLTVDQAQTRAADYFNTCLIKGLDRDWIKDIYGYDPDSLGKNLQNIFNDHTSFFKGQSILATGTMLKTCLATDPKHAGAIQKISQEKLNAAWNAVSSGEQSAEYQTVTSALYIKGYHDAVNGIQAYIADGAEKWGKAYYDYLIKPETILLWQIQLASSEFDNVKMRMYEWHTKLSVLVPDKDYANQILSIAYSALLGVMYSKMRWSEDIKSFLHDVLEQALNGEIDFADGVAKQAAEEQRKILEDMVSGTKIGLDIMDAMSNVLTFWQNKNPKLTWKDYFLKGNILTTDITSLLENATPQNANAFSRWVNKVGVQKAVGALKSLCYFAAAGYLIYTIASQSGQKVTVKQVVVDCNLGIVALAAGLKAVQNIFTLGVGSKISNWARGDAFASFAKNIAQWFKEDGAINASSKFGKAMTAIFGEDIGKFFGRRLGPVLAVFGIIMSAWALVDAIMSGAVANIVFEALNTVMAFAVTIALGFEMASFAWAGPVGIAIAVVGLIIAVTQLIYTLVNPPKPPKDTIERFVEGPMTAQGLTTTA